VPTKRPKVQFLNSDQSGGGNIRSLPGRRTAVPAVHGPGTDRHEAAPAACCCGGNALVVCMDAVATVRVEGDQPVRVTFRYAVPGEPTGRLSSGLALSADGTLWATRHAEPQQATSSSPEPRSRLRRPSAGPGKGTSTPGRTDGHAAGGCPGR